jgi:hypothetical protein
MRLISTEDETPPNLRREPSESQKKTFLGRSPTPVGRFQTQNGHSQGTLRRRGLAYYPKKGTLADFPRKLETSLVSTEDEARSQFAPDFRGFQNLGSLEPAKLMGPQ